MTFTPHPKPAACSLREMSDAQLAAHLAALEAFYELELPSIEDDWLKTVTEYDRRGRGAYVLTPAAEEYLAYRTGATA